MALSAVPVLLLGLTQVRGELSEFTTLPQRNGSFLWPPGERHLHLRCLILRGFLFLFEIRQKTVVPLILSEVKGENRTFVDTASWIPALRAFLGRA